MNVATGKITSTALAKKLQQDALFSEAKHVEMQPKKNHVHKASIIDGEIYEYLEK